MIGYSVKIFTWNDGLGFQLPEGLVSELGLVEGDDIGFEVLGPKEIAIYRIEHTAGADQAKKQSSSPGAAE